MRKEVDPEADAGSGLAARAGVSPEYIAQLRALGILAANDERTTAVGDVRWVRLIQGLERGGLPLELIGQAIRQGDLSLEFVDQPSYDRFAAVVNAADVPMVAIRSLGPVELKGLLEPMSLYEASRAN